MNPNDEFRALIFGEGLLEDTLREIKKISIRNYREEAHNFKKDEIVQGVFLDGLNILLRITADTEVTTFRELPDSVAQEDGYEDAKDAFEKLHTYYPDLQLDDKAGIIRYEILTVKGIPVVSLGEEN